jgi:hypothetical protein
MLANLAATCMLLLSLYAHWSIPRQVQGPERIFLTRILLATVGAALGVFAVQFGHVADVRDASALALFLIGFGQVTPAAVVLFLKSACAGMVRRRGRLIRPPLRLDSCTRSD